MQCSCKFKTNVCYSQQPELSAAQITTAPMHTPSRRRQALESQLPVWKPMTLAQSLDAAAAKFGERPLVITDAHVYSYREIQQWSYSLALGLIECGVSMHAHVAVVLANFPEFVAVKYAIARIGAVAVPINYALRSNELDYIIAQSDSEVLITMDHLRERSYLHDLDELAAGWETAGGGAHWPRLRHIFVHATAGSLRAGAKSLAQLTAKSPAASHAELLRRQTLADPHSRSDVIYTSGTTGLPKGVMLSHDMILRAAYASAYTRAFEDGRRILFSLPMYHVFGYVECLVACTFAGGAIVPQLVFDAQKMLASALTHRASEMVCVPMMTLKLLEVARQQGFDASHLVAMFNSGGASPPTIWQEIREVLGAREVLTAYGMTETTASTTCTLPEGPDEALLNTNGCLKKAGVAGDPALDGVLVQYKAIDPVTGENLPPGASGELVARGPIVTSGYYKKDEETHAAFTADGWLHTGDVGRIDVDGYLTLTGRLKETYRCGGEMVMPREIEDLLNQHPLVEQAFVVGLPDMKMGEVGCVCVLPTGDTLPEPQELIDLCASRLARFKVPKHVIFISAEELPLTATGRAQKFRLAELAKQRVALAAAATLEHHAN
jgi:fatty-acyl-CoA synthase